MNHTESCQKHGINQQIFDYLWKQCDVDPETFSYESYEYLAQTMETYLDTGSDYASAFHRMIEHVVIQYGVTLR
jgi:hypothetical protein